LVRPIRDPPEVETIIFTGNNERNGRDNMVNRGQGYNGPKMLKMDGVIHLLKARGYLKRLVKHGGNLSFILIIGGKVKKSLK